MTVPIYRDTESGLQADSFYFSGKMAGRKFFYAFPSYRQFFGPKTKNPTLTTCNLRLFMLYNLWNYVFYGFNSLQVSIDGFYFHVAHAAEWAPGHR